MQRDLLLLGEMIHASERAHQLTSVLTLEDLQADQLRSESLLWNFTVLGEAAARLVVRAARPYRLRPSARSALGIEWPVSLSIGRKYVISTYSHDGRYEPPKSFVTLFLSRMPRCSAIAFCVTPCLRSVTRIQSAKSRFGSRFPAVTCPPEDLDAGVMPRTADARP